MSGQVSKLRHEIASRAPCWLSPLVRRRTRISCHLQRGEIQGIYIALVVRLSFPDRQPDWVSFRVVRMASGRSDCRSESEFSVSQERRYYASLPASYRGHEGLLPYLELLDPHPEKLFAAKRVLDIGAGECAYTGLIAEQLGAKHVVALDLIRARMLPAKGSIRARNLAFVQGNCYELPFPEESFDVVFGDLVLHHLPNLRVVVSEIRRVLKPTGLYLGLEPNFENPLQSLFFFIRGNSRNEHRLMPRTVYRVFRDGAFSTVEVRYVWRRFPWLHHHLVTSEVAILARV